MSEIETSFEDSVSSGAEDSQVATATLSLCDQAGPVIATMRVSQCRSDEGH